LAHLVDRYPAGFATSTRRCIRFLVWGESLDYAPLYCATLRLGRAVTGLRRPCKARFYLCTSRCQAAAVDTQLVSRARRTCL